MPKVILLLPVSVIEKLGGLAKQIGFNRTQVVREAVEVRYKLQEEIDKGGKIFIERKDKTRVQVELSAPPKK